MFLRPLQYTKTFRDVLRRPFLPSLPPSLPSPTACPATSPCSASGLRPSLSFPTLLAASRNLQHLSGRLRVVPVHGQNPPSQQNGVGHLQFLTAAGGRLPPQQPTHHSSSKARPSGTRLP